MQTVQENILDVTQYEPRQKHPTIFKKFDELNAGEQLVLHNDHDPKPLYYQLLGERGDIFNWEYLEQGPDWWKVRITKRHEEEGKESIGQLAIKDLRKAAIFKKYGLDFCCGGKKTVREACADKGLDATKVEQELQQAEKHQDGGRQVDYTRWSLDFLADYILNTHHSYVREALPELRGYASKVAKVHGENHKELKHIQQLMEEINEELLDHMEQEERQLFPYVKQLVQAKNNMQSPLRQARSLSELVESMEKDHDSVGRAFDLIRKLSDGYSLPQDACASYSLLFKMLQEFEEDLHQHVNLENNLLFPKAIELEKELTAL